jgi:16S rRNA (guanine1516-N2)-methyltransferase
VARFHLHQDNLGFSLKDKSSRIKPLRIDFDSSKLYRRRRQIRSEQLVKAVDARPGKHIIDCTAGLGTDSFLVAAAGARVTLLEKSHTLFLMLQDALDRGHLVNSEGSVEVSQAVSRMHLLHNDAVQYLGRLKTRPHGILIDPMYPGRPKSAQVKGEMQILQNFLGKDQNVAPLFEAALRTRCPRIVVKRPQWAAQFTGRVPLFTVDGKASRLEVYSAAL